YRDLIVGVSGKRSDWAIRSWTDPKWEPLRRRTIQLYDAILQPIADRLRAANQIIFVPTGLLYYLPLHALGQFDPRAKEIRFLIQEKPVSYLTNATLLTVVGEARPIRPALLALGNPPFKHDKPRLMPLDRAEEEVEALSKLFGGQSLVLKGPDATKENLLALLGASGPKARSELLAKRGAALPAGEGFGFVHLASSPRHARHPRARQTQGIVAGSRWHEKARGAGNPTPGLERGEFGDIERVPDRPRRRESRRGLDEFGYVH
ncbi:MAG: CHAT domain-containing protein, partial [Deltaproteobacteria bacterium]|nr:CHAT domain-containing protein [Deltaproteobacteria bacterium]